MKNCHELQLELKFNTNYAFKREHGLRIRCH